MNFNTFSHTVYLLHIQLYLAPVKSNALINNITMTDRSTISNNASENSKDSQMPTISPTSINFNLEASILLLS